MVLDVGIHQPLSVQFTPADANNYLPATRTVYINVKGANLGTQISFINGHDAKTGSRTGWYVVTEVDTKRVLAKWYALSGSTDSGPFTTLPLSFASVHVTVTFYPEGGGAPITMKVLNPTPGTAYGWATKGECAAIEVEYP